MNSSAALLTVSGVGVMNVRSSMARVASLCHDVACSSGYAPAQQMIVLRRQVTVEVDRSQEFTKDAVLVRGRYRLGLGIPSPQTIVKLTNVDAPVIS